DSRAFRDPCRYAFSAAPLVRERRLSLRPGNQGDSRTFLPGTGSARHGRSKARGLDKPSPTTSLRSPIPVLPPELSAPCPGFGVAASTLARNRGPCWSDIGST